jgi:hypoxanthine phosphoribosyltransferase
MSHTWILKDKVFTKYLGSDEIQTAVRSLANRISQDLQDTKPVFIVVLNGAFIFAAIC